MKKWLNYLNNSVSDDGVLTQYTVASRFLGDWATPHGSEYGNTPAAKLFNNCVYAYNLNVFVQTANTTSGSYYGSMVSNWSREGTTGKFHIEVPPNTSATVYIATSRMSPKARSPTVRPRASPTSNPTPAMPCSLSIPESTISSALAGAEQRLVLISDAELTVSAEQVDDDVTRQVGLEIGVFLKLVVGLF